MPKAILFDLDNTLLGNSMEAFMPAYFRALTRYMAHLIPPEQLISELVRGTQAMSANDGNGFTNEETFATVFYPAVGYERAALEPTFRQFYAEEFPNLQALTQTRPEARPLVEFFFERGLQVAIATNPLFPRDPIEQRLEWADVPVTEFDYALVTCYEDMHATKAHPAYYREVLAQLGRQPDECLMIGDHWEWDIAQAASVGIPVYWIAEPDASPHSLPPGSTPPSVPHRSDPPPLPPHSTSPSLPPRRGDERGVLVGQGTLADLWDWIKRSEDDRGEGARGYGTKR